MFISLILLYLAGSQVNMNQLYIAVLSHWGTHTYTGNNQMQTVPVTIRMKNSKDNNIIQYNSTV